MTRRTVGIAGHNEETEKDLPAHVEISVSADNMSAMIQHITQPRGNSPDLTIEDVEKALAEKKVAFGIKETVIRQLVSAMPMASENNKNILVAEGMPPTDGEDATIVFKAGEQAENQDEEADIYVRPTEVIAEIISPTEAVNGINVLEKEIKAKKGKPCGVKAGKNVTLSEDKTGFTADIYGVVERADNSISVKAPLIVSEDKMSADLVICPRLSDNSLLTMDDVLSLLEHEGITHGIMRDNIEAALQADQPEQSVRVAEGTPSMGGEDAKLVLKTGENAENKDRQAANFVKPGQIIAEIAPPAEPVNGVTILGKEIKAKKGKPCDVKTGTNVTLSVDKMGFTAEIYGVVKLIDNRVCVYSPLVVSDDKMSADIAISPRLSDNSLLTMEEVLNNLEHEGVTHGIREDNIEAALQPELPVQVVRVAEGMPPKDGEDAKLKYYFTLNNNNPEAVDSERKGENPINEDEIQKELFSAGELLVEKIPAVMPENGFTIFGKEIIANQPKDRQLTAGEGVKITENGLQYIVDDQEMGYANIVNDTLSVEDPIRISDDQLEAHVCVHSPSDSKRLMTTEMVMDRLTRLGIKRGIDKEAIQKSGDLAGSKANTVHRLLIAKGKAPQNGEVACFRFFFQTDKQPGQSLDEASDIDFKERGTIQTAKAGDTLAQKILPTSGEDGFGVFNNLMIAEAGRDWNLTSLGGVSVSEDGRTYRAEVDGMITLVCEDRIGVFNSYEISGDVDLTTGNLDMDGSLLIKGCIREGFSVKANGDIIVSQGVEDAVLRCGANLKVNRGIFGKGKNIIIARGDIYSDFVESARINAVGNIFVKNSIARSFITSKGRVDVSSGKGRIMGGTIFALNGVKVNEIGSETGIKTIIRVGRSPKPLKIMKRYEKRLASLRKNSRRINFTIGNLKKKSETVALDKEGQIALEKLKKLRRREAKLENREAMYEKILKEELNKEKKSIGVEVRHTVHEGTIIIIHGYEHKVKKKLRGKGKFVLNSETLTIEYI